MRAKLFTLLLGMFIASYGISQCADQANIYSFQYNGKNYEIVKEKQNWSDAAACDVERGGYLIEIDDANEQSAIYDTLINASGVATNYTSVADGGGIAYVWIGATDQANEGTWVWDGNDDGTGMNFWNGQGAAGAGNGSVANNAFIYWGGANTSTYNEPDDYGSGQDYAAIGLDGWPGGSGSLGIAGEWNDIAGSNTLYYIIEFDSTNTSINHSEKQEVGIYPNPAREKFVIRDEQVRYNKYELMDMTGRLIDSGKAVDNTVVQTDELQSGIYIVRLSNEKESIQKKVIIE